MQPYSTRECLAIEPTGAAAFNTGVHAGLVQSKWKPWEPRGGASATVGRQGPSRGGAWATVGVVIFGCLLKVASMA